MTDSGALNVSAGLGCTPAAANRVTCSTSGVSSISVDAGDGDDSVTLAGLALPATLADGSGNDTITGGSGNDTFVGAPGDDTLSGGPGNDTFGDAGGTGADTLAGGTGTDTADYASRSLPVSVRLDDVAGDGAAGEGDDVRTDVETVNGGSAADTLIGSSGADTLRGNGGDDLLDGRAGADTLAGGSGTDTADYSSRAAAVTVTLDGTAGDGETGENDNVGTDVDVVLGGAGNDTITGHGASNELRGNDGNDTLNGAGGDDALSGGAGADRLDGGTGNDTLDGGSGADNLIGGNNTDVADYASRREPVTGDLNGTTGFGEAGENDTVAADVEGVAGGAGDDVLTGDGGANVLRGGGGDDVLDGRLGADDVSGGDGSDSVSYAARTTGVTIKLDNSANDGAAGEVDNVRSDVERIAGGTGGDTLNGDDDANVIAGNGGSDTIAGNGGDDTITAGSGSDQIWGGSGNDTIAAGDGTNKVYGEDGNDTLSTGTGTDTLDGGGGDDTLVSGAGNDTLTGGTGNDALSAADGSDKLYGGAGNDALAAGSGDDTVDGGDGDDTLDAADGKDKLYGGDGADVLDAGTGDDAGDGGAGNDRVLAGEGNDSLSGGAGDDTLDGGAGDDALSGNDGNDGIAGGAGNDKLSGNADNDVLGGGAGNDQLWGGSGDDTLADDQGDNKLYGEDGLDKVTAGDGNDVLSGGGGDDLLAAGGGDDTLNGDNDADRLQGGDGNDTLYGGSGDDVLDGGLGADAMDGADGQDTVDYGNRTIGVVVTNDGKADDGQKGEGDNVASTIDNAIGGAGADRITFATDWPHQLDGGDGDDLLRGGGQADRLVGGRGKDFLFGEGGKDSYDGGPGNDHLSSTDGVGEKLQCGAGNDVSVQDKGDTAVACEKRTIGKLATTEAPAKPESEARPQPSRTPPNALPVSTPVRAPSGLVGVKRVSSRGKLAYVPGFAGVRVDRRILADIAWIRKHYPIRIVAGYAMSGHALHGEHPLGLALDIVPGPGGSWDDIDRLAKWAEPRQNYPRAPFRWVGYNGDVNHGRGNHLHLSWMHAAAKPGTRPAWVVTMRFKHGAASGGARKPAPTRGAGALVRYARSSNRALGGHPSYKSGIKRIRRCQGAGPLKPAMKAAARAFGLRWRIIAGLTETESGFGCNMGPSSAGAIGWTQFMPATWSSWGMDADGDGKADPYNSVDAVFSTARLLRASGAPKSYRRALYAYNHSWEYVRIVLERSKKY